MRSDYFTFPPIKKIFKADPGMTWVEADLAGADARVVAWRAKDEDLINAFERGEKIHVKNGCDIFGREAMYSKSNSGKSEPFYTRVKKGVHATNYGAREGAFARCGMTKDEWIEFQSTWFRLHPAIGEWHREVEFLLQSTRMLSNPFGFTNTYRDRPGAVFNNALAWEPSSVVAEVTYIAMRRLARGFRPQVQIMLQVHDSLCLQIPTRILGPTLRDVHQMFQEITVPYPRPLIIPWELKMSTSSWGECEEVKWSDAY